MIQLDILIKNIKAIAVLLLVVCAVWFYKDYQFQKSENQRQTENAFQLRRADSLRFSSQNLTLSEIKDYLEYQNSDLKNKLEKEGIELNRIQSIVSSNYKYRDTVKKETDVSGIVDAIKNSIPKEQSWTDTTKCLTIKGNVSFDGQKLKVTVSDREFKNKSDGVAYWQRREWNFLGIKTRFLGKKNLPPNNLMNVEKVRCYGLRKKNN